MTHLLGIDASALQGVLPWRVIREADIAFAMLRCSVGNESWQDPRFLENLRAGAYEGIFLGAYHFAYPLPVDGVHPGRAAKEQAERAFKLSHMLGASCGELPPALDLEWPPREKPGQAAGEEWKRFGCSARQIAEWGLVYLERMEQLAGVVPILYSYPFFIECLSLQNYPEYAKYPLWIAGGPNYINGNGKVPEDPKPPMRLPWKDWTFWQFDGNGGMKLPNGVDADFNLFHGGWDELAKLTRGSATPPNPQNQSPPWALDKMAQEAQKARVGIV